MLPSRAALLALVLLAAPVAAAAPTHVEGEVALHAPLRLAGAVGVSSAKGALDLAPVVQAGMPLALVIDGGEGDRVSYTRTNLGVHPSDPELRSTEVRAGAARLTNFTCQEGCVVLLHALGGDSRVEVQGVADGALAWTREARSYALFSHSGARGTYRYDVEPGWVQASPDLRMQDGALPLAAAAASTQGRTRLLVEGASFDLVEGNATRHVDTRKHAQDGPAAPLGVSVGTRTDYAYLLMTVEGARVETDPAAPLVLLAPDARVLLEGSLATSRATGTLAADGERHALQDEPLEAEGTFDLSPLVATSGARVQKVDVLGGQSATLAFEGEATRLRAAAYEVAAPVAPAETALVTLAALALLAYLAKLLWFPLYTRLSRTHLLAHPRRADLLASLEARPGQSVMELSRGTGIARVVVRHHLAMLARHGLVVERDAGRRTRYYLPGSRPDTYADALSVATRQRLARALLDARGVPLTQKDLAREVGIAERLVSYHLAHLARLGLVRVEEGRPRRYAATSLLASALESATSGRAAGPSGVPAGAA